MIPGIIQENDTWHYSGEFPYTSNSYILTGGDAYDDIRIHPKDAQMATYTYEPLVEMTSETDGSGRTTYYDYDGFHRLRYMKNGDREIVKAFCYNYAGQQTDCFPTYTAVGISTPIMKNDCNPGYVSGPPVSYVSSVYSSDLSQQDAQAMADADVAANAQAYANANGTCVPTVIYVRVEGRDWQNGYDNYGDYYIVYTLGSLALRFYSDAECTTSLTLVENTQFKFRTNVNYISDTGSGSYFYDQVITVPAGESGRELGMFYSHALEGFYDSNGNYTWSDVKESYSVVANPPYTYISVNTSL